MPFNGHHEHLIEARNYLPYVLGLKAHGEVGALNAALLIVEILKCSQSALFVRQQLVVGEFAQFLY